MPATQLLRVVKLFVAVFLLAIGIYSIFIIHKLGVRNVTGIGYALMIVSFAVSLTILWKDFHSHFK